MGIYEKRITMDYPRVLVVDAKKENLAEIRQTLAKLNVELYCAQTREQALQLIMQYNFAVILLDVEMPNTDVFETTRLIKNNQNVDMTPIILIATIDEQHHILEGYHCGAIDYLIKPIPPLILHKKIQFFVGLYHQKIKQTICDPLTKLPNRRFLEKELKRYIGFAVRNELKFAVFFIDIDDFKQINDSYGHDIGDAFLRHVADILSNTCRVEDFVTRLGGDEFVLIMSNIKNIADVENKANKLLKTLNIPFEFFDKTISGSVSIGISLYPDSAEDVDDLIRCADQAMYQSKQDGKNTMTRYNSACNFKMV